MSSAVRHRNHPPLKSDDKLPSFVNDIKGHNGSSNGFGKSGRISNFLLSTQRRRRVMALVATVVILLSTQRRCRVMALVATVVIACLYFFVYRNPVMRSSYYSRLAAARGKDDDEFLTRRESWQLTDGDVNAAIALMASDGLTDKEMKDDLRVFLYAKGILREKTSVVRKAEFDDLLNPDDAMVSDEERQNLQSSRKRLRRIVETGEVGKDVNAKASYFDDFVSQHPKWGPATSFVVFRDHELLKDKKHAYAERVQLSGLCYMHAPVILQHYLVAMHSQDAVPMLDMAIYLRKHMSAEALYNHIWSNKGGDSKVFLEKILLQDPVPLIHSFSPDFDLESSLHQYGPGLVSGFKVDKNFDSKLWEHIGMRKIDSDLSGRHAMVLVGIRKENDVPRFLLQNWWKEKPFVEVDADYLVSCGALIHFVRSVQNQMGQFPTNSHNHVECEMLDAEETFAPEMLH